MTHLVIIGGSDAGIAAALRAKECDATANATVVIADAFPKAETVPWSSWAFHSVLENIPS